MNSTSLKVQNSQLTSALIFFLLLWSKVSWQKEVDENTYEWFKIQNFTLKWKLFNVFTEFYGHVTVKLIFWAQFVSDDLCN